MFSYSHIVSQKSTAVNKIWLNPSPFLISTNRFLILAEGFWNDHVAASGTALRSATEKKETGSYVPCSSKMAQRSSTADGLKF